MDFLPSPPSSPVMMDKVVCGTCDKALSSDWYCSDCHTKCDTCNRFLSENEYCTRCWTFDHRCNGYIRKEARLNLYHWSQSDKKKKSIPLFFFCIQQDSGTKGENIAQHIYNVHRNTNW
ncbi:hypothetical protein K501DRAFT_9650 [Backusella circina FSU 941]|nr:hypothetical protein K501DRAFT_9650 [Backusella circina FSU 941]